MDTQEGKSKLFSSEKFQLDDELTEKLKALGYMNQSEEFIEIRRYCNRKLNQQERVQKPKISLVRVVDSKITFTWKRETSQHWV